MQFAIEYDPDTESFRRITAEGSIPLDPPGTLPRDVCIPETK
jgi:hypothetical protein